MNNLIKNYNEDNRGGKKQPPHNKKFDFKLCKNNVRNSLNETEYFLNHIQELSRYIKLYKFFR